MAIALPADIMEFFPSPLEYRCDTRAIEEKRSRQRSEGLRSSAAGPGVVGAPRQRRSFPEMLAYQFGNGLSAPHAVDFVDPRLAQRQMDGLTLKSPTNEADAADVSGRERLECRYGVRASRSIGVRIHRVPCRASPVRRWNRGLMTVGI
jgi:hypothetical protein